MTGERTTIGSITDAVNRYGLADGAEAWEHICYGWFISTGHGLVRLEADPDRRDGTLWIVEEVTV